MVTSAHSQIKRSFIVKKKVYCSKDVVNMPVKDVTYAIYVDGKFSQESKSLTEAETLAKTAKTTYIEVTKDEMKKLSDIKAVEATKEEIIP
jgi:hypothetical protein